MRNALRTAGLVLAALAALAAGAAAESPNILLITIDTLRPDRLSCYGSTRLQTPRMDGLASKGVVFERAFAHDPETLPSHSNIMTGLTALAHGVSENSKSRLAADFQTLAEYLKARGYATGAFVSAFSLDSRFGLDQGFDVYDDRVPSKAAPGLVISERAAPQTITAALAWLAGQKGPWFCWVHLWEPHDPYLPPEPFATQYKDDLYSGEVAYVDTQIGVLLDTVEKKGPGDPIVVLTGDHGESLGEHGEVYHGYFAYDATLWVPLIVVAPAVKPARVKDSVGHIDLFPTICDLIGSPKPPALQGDSLLPLLKGRTRKAKPIYIEALEGYLNRGWAPLRGFIENGRKFIDSPIPELYDLERDFDEAKNLDTEAGRPALRKRLQEIMKLGASPLAAASGRATTDRETRERLSSLGYAASRLSQLKTTYGPEDDPKTLVPFEVKVGRATELLRQGRPAESVKILEDVLAQRKDVASAYSKLFDVYRSQGLIDDAFGVYERALAAMPGNYDVLSGYGIALVKNGRFAKGVEILEKCLSLFDQDPDVWNSLGVAHSRLGDFEKAKGEFDRALALAPSDASFNDNLGTYYVTLSLRRKDPELAKQALPCFEKALARDPGLASVYNGKAGALRLLGRRDEAIASWEKAVEVNPRFDLALYNLAIAYLEKGDKAKALDACRRYVEAKGRTITPEERQEIQALIEKCKAPGTWGGS